MNASHPGAPYQRLRSTGVSASRAAAAPVLGGTDLRILAPGTVALGVLLSMIGIVQKALWSGKVYGFWEPVSTGAVAFGPFINRNHFAGWMPLALPVAVRLTKRALAPPGRGSTGTSR